MIENIDRVLERGERIELLVDKTDRLNQQAFKFEKTVRYNSFVCCHVVQYSYPVFGFLFHFLFLQSRTLKNTMYYRKIRNIAIVVVFVLVSPPHFYILTYLSSLFNISSLYSHLCRSSSFSYWQLFADLTSKSARSLHCTVLEYMQRRLDLFLLKLCRSCNVLHDDAVL